MTTAANNPDTCPHCGLIHKTTCPRIRSIEYENGIIKRIEFHAPANDTVVGAIDAFFNGGRGLRR